jgi:hypothetical protein
MGWLLQLCFNKKYSDVKLLIYKYVRFQVKELDLEAVKELAVEELDLEREGSGKEHELEREGSSARDGGRSAARGTAAESQGGPAGARARPGRRAGRS